MKRSLLLPSLIGAALLAALASAPLGHANESIRGQIDGLKKAAAGLRQLATRALPANFDQESTSEYTKQTTWLKNAAGRCDALAKKLQAAGSKGATTSTKGKGGTNRAAEEFPSLRSALQKENGEFSFGSQQAKARQEEAKEFFNALGQ